MLAMTLALAFCSKYDSNVISTTECYIKQL